jgi:indole-3-glycerol phosphate synthase
MLVIEIARPLDLSPRAEPRALGQLAVRRLKEGFDAIAVCCDGSDSSDSLQDLVATVRAIEGCPSYRDVPVLAKDWLLHPLQLLDTVDAGAAGFLGLVRQVSGGGTMTLSRFGTALGLDVPVEVVNAQEAAEAARAGVSLYALGTSVGISVSVPGFRESVTEGVLETLPFGSLSIVGVRTVEECRRARYAGADALLVRREMIEGLSDREVVQLVDDIRYACSGDE